MENSINILIVDNNHAKNLEKQQAITQNGLSKDVKVAMNAGHALLYLDHIHLNHKIYDSNLVIILNMDTPISNGYDFLNTYHHSSKLKKDKILIVVINENLCEESQERIKRLGVSDFIHDSFPMEKMKEIISKRFNESAEIAVHNTSNQNHQPQAASAR